jgi:hypothetical protein
VAVNVCGCVAVNIPSAGSDTSTHCRLHGQPNHVTLAALVLAMLVYAPYLPLGRSAYLSRTDSRTYGNQARDPL